MRTKLLCLAILLAAPAAGQTVRAGIDAWQKGDAKAAVAIWKPLADKGDPDAAFNLGQAYRLGKGVPLDLAQAQGWLERAARKNHVDAQTTLGLLLFQNGNRFAAMRWLRPAATAGEARAMLIYGTALYNGDGVPEDEIAGYAFISRAAAQGLGPAAAALADLDQTMPLEKRKQGLARAQAMMAVKSKSPEPAKAAPSRSAHVQQMTPKPVAAGPVVSQPVAVGARGSWRIQLGAFSQKQSAERLFGQVSPRLPGVGASYVPAGKMIRLQVGPFSSRAAASSACARLAPQPCFPVGGR